MNYIKPIYKTVDTITSKLLIDFYDFRSFSGETVYRFPVYKYNNKPLIFTEMAFNEDENQIHIRAVDNNGNNYNYNKEYYGESDVIEIINKNIRYKLDEFNKKGIIKSNE